MKCFKKLDPLPRWRRIHCTTYIYTLVKHNMNSRPSTEPVVLGPGRIGEMPIEGFSRELDGGNVTWRTLFCASKTPTDTFVTGIGTCGPRDGHLKCHRHTHAEIYHVTQGRGMVSINGVEYPVEKGSVVFIPGDAEHGIRNITEEEDLTWLYVFATDTFENVIYRFDEPGPRAKL